MNHPTRPTVRLALAAAVLLLAKSDRPAATAEASDSPAAVARIHEVRLRKFHLVRPDLIPYPVAREVYC